MLLTRRSLLRGLVAAPAVVAVQNIMPVRLFVPDIRDWSLNGEVLWRFNWFGDYIIAAHPTAPAIKWNRNIASEHFRAIQKWVLPTAPSASTLLTASD
jgi:hypothetical protein